MVDLEGERLLGRHVAGRAEDAIARSQRGRVDQPAGQPEVDDPQLAVRPEHEIRGLDVAVHHAPRGGRREAAGGLDQVVEAMLPREAADIVEQLRQRPPLDVLHDVIGTPALLADRVDARHVGMVDRRQEPRLAREARVDLVFRPHLCRDRLERDPALEPGVESSEDGSHPALAEQRLDPVVVDERADQRAGVARGPRALGRFHRLVPSRPVRRR